MLVLVLDYFQAYSRVIEKSLSLKHEPALEPLRISVKKLFFKQSWSTLIAANVSINCVWAMEIKTRLGNTSKSGACVW